jgi:hypothetical protein
MEPFSLAVSVTSAARLCLAAGQGLYSLRDRYRHASITITSIFNESKLMSAFLGRIQSLLQQNGDTIIEEFNEQPQLKDIFEEALANCTIVYSRLDAEVQRLRQDTNHAGELSRWGRMRHLWKEETMKDLLQSVRFQTMTISSLLQCLQVFVMPQFQQHHIRLRSCREAIAKLHGQVEGLQRIVINNNARLGLSVTPAKPLPTLPIDLYEHHRTLPGGSDTSQDIELPVRAVTTTFPTNSSATSPGTGFQESNADDNASIVGLAP